MFNNLTTDGFEENRDSLGGYQPKETNIYSGKIKVAYAIKSAGGANGIVFVIALEDGTEYRETVYITNKKGENFYLNQNKKKVALPGFTVADDICLCASNKTLAQQTFEEKVVNVWDSDAKKELPKAMPVAVDLIDQDISLAILRSIENRSELNKSTGNYEATAETREVNTIDKVFHTASKMTTVEARNGAEAPKFWDSWLERNKGNTRDRRTIKDGQSSGTAGAPKAADSAPKTNSLFG